MGTGRKLLITGTMLLMMPAMQLQAAPVVKENKEAKAAEQAKPAGVRQITWQELMPPLDEKVVSQYEAGEISREDAVEYMEKLGKTPVEGLDKSKVRIPGFLVPLNINKDQVATELLLVPTMGACVHVPPPPPNQTVYVRFEKGIKVTEAAYTPYWLEGTLKVEKNKSEYTETLYGMNVDTIKEYE